MPLECIRSPFNDAVAVLNGTHLLWTGGTYVELYSVTHQLVPGKPFRMELKKKWGNGSFWVFHAREAGFGTIVMLTSVPGHLIVWSSTTGDKHHLFLSNGTVLCFETVQELQAHSQGLNILHFTTDLFYAHPRFHFITILQPVRDSAEYIFWTLGADQFMSRIFSEEPLTCQHAPIWLPDGVFFFQLCMEHGEIDPSPQQILSFFKQARHPNLDWAAQTRNELNLSLSVWGTLDSHHRLLSDGMEMRMECLVSKKQRSDVFAPIVPNCLSAFRRHFPYLATSPPSLHVYTFWRFESWSYAPCTQDKCEWNIELTPVFSSIAQVKCISDRGWCVEKDETSYRLRAIPEHTRYVLEHFLLIEVGAVLSVPNLWILVAEYVC
jgi:hypothetical protein